MSFQDADMMTPQQYSSVMMPQDTEVTLQDTEIQPNRYSTTSRLTADAQPSRLFSRQTSRQDAESQSRQMSKMWKQASRSAARQASAGSGGGGGSQYVDASEADTSDAPGYQEPAAGTRSSLAVTGDLGDTTQSMDENATSATSATSGNSGGSANNSDEALSTDVPVQSFPTYFM